jgi:HEAT repeat protein
VDYRLARPVPLGAGLAGKVEIMTQRAKMAAAVALLGVLTAGWIATRTVQARRNALAARDPRLGQQRAWSLRFDVRLAHAGQKAPMQMQLVGEWQATLSATRAGEYDVAYQIANPHIEGSGVAGVAPAEISALERRLSQRFWMTYRDDGTALRAHFPRQMEPSDRNLLQMIATDVQLVRPARPGTAEQWTALERDGAGRYLAAYQRTAPHRIVKRKLKYTDVDVDAGNQGPGGIEIDFDASERTFVLDAEGAIESFDGSEHFRIGMPMGRGGFLDIGTATHLSGVRRTLASELAGSLERARAEVDSVPVRTHAPDPERVRADQDRQLLFGQDGDQLLAAAQAVDAVRADPLLPPRLAALLRQRPASVAAAETVLRKRGGCPLITGALGAAATPASMAALDRLARDAGAPSQLRSDALSALAKSERPDTAAMRLAATLLDDDDAGVRRSAALVAGALARAGRPNHPAEASQLDQALLSRYQAATTIERRSELLAALGNSVGPAVVPVLQAALRDSQPELRASAARALRLADDAATTALLGATITSDRDPRVRAAAVFAASFQPIGPHVDALVAAATRDATDFVRADAVGLLKRNRSVSAKIPEALAQVAAHDAKPGLRRLATEALE